MNLFHVLDLRYNHAPRSFLFLFSHFFLSFFWFLQSDGYIIFAR
jgi:hypothetical protein